MTGLDWILLGVLLLSLILGAWRGLVFEVLSVLGWAAAFILAQWLAPEVGALLPMASWSDPLRYAAAFTLTFVLAAFAAGLLASLIRKLVSVIGLRPVDRVFGAAFGLVRGLVILLALTVVAEVTGLKSKPWWQASTGAALLSVSLQGLKPVLPEGFARYLN